ncbi:MAG: phenylacetate--CoA ligase family protein [Gammaproteobacteria bacterium]|nr:phenylacetate--CoA ligase family protein [Gammaproteobacteria bacterium]MBU1980289.1 phenylacetate--CoA ligase family protein [Gammaproteobacteria bacterium]
MTSNASPLIPASSFRSVAWPSMPDPVGTAMLALQYQLNQTQWLSPEALQEQQFSQLQSVLTHAYKTIQFYRVRLDTIGFKPHQPITPEQFLSLALLRRSEIQSAGESLLSQHPPKDHGRILTYQTSGSTGRPIKAFGTDITHFFWNALTLRDHLWHKRNFSGKLASIRTTVQDGVSQGWGPATDVAFKTGQIAMLNIRADINSQLQWLQAQNPDYLLSHPSNILALAHRCIQKRIPLTKLREVRAFGETVTPELRAACSEAWDVSVKAVYSAEEVGYIALQCPEYEHYHIQSENLLVEILNDENQACEPGEIGRVVITTLHNFAMPLIRYEILDYAEAGEPCPCGRGLPVIKRVMGRQRNLVTLPNGKQHWPSFPAESWAFIAPIRQIQLVQRELDIIEARLVTDRPLNAEEARELVAVLQEHLGYPFQITLQYMQQIEHKANFKYEDFISEIPA